MQTDTNVTGNAVRSAEVHKALFHALELLRVNRPAERSDESRFYAVTTTLVEQAYAYFSTYVVLPEMTK